MHSSLRFECCHGTMSSSSLQGLVEVVTSSDDQLAVRATILLGELLHMVILKCGKRCFQHFFIFSVVYHLEIIHTKEETCPKIFMLVCQCRKNVV